VLTSNLLLSVWAPVRAPAGSSASWERVLVANRAAAREWEGREAGAQRKRNGWEAEESPEGRRFQRARCFAWAPLAGARGEGEEEFLVAVANDEMEVLVVEVRSPYSRPWDGGEWDAELRGRIGIASSEVLRPSLDWTFEDYIANPDHVAQLAWSPWVAGGDGTVASLIACATGKGVEFVRAVRQLADSSIALEKVDFAVPPATEHAPGGPLKFDTVVAENTVTLVADLADELVSCVIDVADPASMAVKRVPREEWGEISGNRSSRCKRR
jgi:hypothetical protein